jgi:hypothetical protein
MLSIGEENEMSETGLFWLIHAFIGLVLPAMTFFGCCKEKDDASRRSSFQSG